MVAKRKTTRRRSLKSKLKTDPIGETKNQINKTGWGKYFIGATLLGAIGGTAMAVQMKKIPMVGGMLGVMATKGANLVSKMK